MGHMALMTSCYFVIFKVAICSQIYRSIRTSNSLWTETSKTHMLLILKDCICKIIPRTVAWKSPLFLFPLWPVDSYCQDFCLWGCWGFSRSAASARVGMQQGGRLRAEPQWPKCVSLSDCQQNCPPTATWLTKSSTARQPNILPHSLK